MLKGFFSTALRLLDFELKGTWRGALHGLVLSIFDLTVDKRITGKLLKLLREVNSLISEFAHLSASTSNAENTILED
jgi:hypothetical protein